METIFIILVLVALLFILFLAAVTCAVFRLFSEAEQEKERLSRELKEKEALIKELSADKESLIEELQILILMDVFDEKFLCNWIQRKKSESVQVSELEMYKDIEKFLFTHTSLN